MKARFLIPVIVVIGLLGILGIGLTLDPRTVPSPLIGKSAPVFALPKLYQPDQLLTNNDLQGQLSLVNVWASWCVACRQEHAQVERLSKEFNLRVIGLNYKDKPRDARDWLSQFGNPYTEIAVDESGRVGIDWGVYGVPETFIIDANGFIRYKHIGPITASDIDSIIMPLIADIQGTEKQ